MSWQGYRDNMQRKSILHIIQIWLYADFLLYWMRSSQLICGCRASCIQPSQHARHWDLSRQDAAGEGGYNFFLNAIALLNIALLLYFPSIPSTCLLHPCFYVSPCLSPHKVICSLMVTPLHHCLELTFQQIPVILTTVSLCQLPEEWPHGCGC